ncbi:MAG TPA: acyltransferase family protein, partial [Acidimicrobiia bacterium]|nr:acyltransferase family protein [Acidimicrobiia bacterium]
RASTVRDLSYVGGVDGLRALAVLAVIVYHFSPKTLPAGFLGVDVFFVVSGFLIARLVVREIAQSSQLSLTHFWARRARRLLPALGTVVVVVCIASAISLTTLELHDIRAQAIGTLFYVANWVLIAGKGAYFSTVGRPSPFLHMWSLAIEEQFYVVFPIVCFFARRAIVRRPERAAIVALVGALGSTIWMALLVSPNGDPSRAYLGTGSHAMGLLVGVALGILAGTGTRWSTLPRWTAHVGLLALIGIGVTMVWATDRTYFLYRGGFLLFSLAVGVLLTVVVLSPGAPVARFLRWRPFVEIGLRSYSLYLWHWPVRVFVTPHAGFDGWKLFLVRSIWSVVLAEVSFRLIERPFRFGGIARRTGARGAIAYYAAMVVITLVLVTTVAKPSKIPQFIDVRTQHGKTHVDLFGDSTALVFGLSGANHWQDLDVTVAGDARLGCGLVVEPHVIGGRTVTEPNECLDWKSRWTQSAHDPSAVMAIMAGGWDVLDQAVNGKRVRFGTPEWTDLETRSVRDAFTTLTAGGRPLYVFEVPCYGSGDPSAPIPERADRNRVDAVNAIYRQVAAENPLVHIVPWRDIVCPNGKRAERYNGVDLWENDDVHLTPEGALAVWEWWLPQIRK